jgi:hypothetical protein
MDDKDFDDLAESIKQAGEIKKGQRPPSRIFDLHPLDDNEFEQSPNPLAPFQP